MTLKKRSWIAALVVMLAPEATRNSFLQAFSPTPIITKSLILYESSSFSDGQEQEQPVLEPTVMVNGEELFSDKTSSDVKNHIFGATAAMAVAIETPLETTLENVQQAGLMDMALLNAKGEVYATANDLAPLVQGHRVALYFGAGWCPSCRELEFMLPQYMKALCESEQKIRLIYVSSDTSLEFQLDRMSKLGMDVGVQWGSDAAKKLKERYGIWSQMEAKDFADGSTTRRSGVPAFVVLDTKGGELKYLNTEADTIAALGEWDLDDPKGVF